MNKSDPIKNTQLEEKKDSRPIWIYILFMMVIPAIVSIILTIFTKNPNLDPKIINILSLAINYILFICFSFMYFKKFKDDIKRLSKKHFIIVLIVSILAVILNFIMTSVLSSLNVSFDNQNLVADLLNIYTAPMLIYVIFLAPVIEELVFRYSLGSIIKNNVIFVIISSILFGIIHGLGLSIFIYIILGLVFSLIYIKTDKNLFSSTLAHIINNLIVTIMMFILG